MSTALHTGDVIKVRQGSMELYWIGYIRKDGAPALWHIGNLQHDDNATRYADAPRIYPGPVTINGVPARIEMGLNGRPRVVA